MVDGLEGAGKVPLREGSLIDAFGQVLTQQTIRVFGGAALPGGVGIGEEDGDAGIVLNAFEGGELD
jgi:hypothetical protein